MAQSSDTAVPSGDGRAAEKPKAIEGKRREMFRQRNMSFLDGAVTQFNRSESKIVSYTELLQKK